MEKILVTGGCGYLGSHTVIDLLENGFDVISADDFSRSQPSIQKLISEITGKPFVNYDVDLCHEDDCRRIFEENPDITGIIHFAAYKAVGESVEKPLLYFNNNLNSLINVLQCATTFNVPHFVFSSSCTVYGNPASTPVNESMPIGKAFSPYGSTKQMGEEIVKAVCEASPLRATLLRYFNPAGAHASGLIGEYPGNETSNLVPAITQTAIGKRNSLVIHGNDYPTRDGTCIRDYIHVDDIAKAHTLALQFLMQKKGEDKCEIFNLGSGNGNTVMEVIKAFEVSTGQKLNFSIGPRRPGDVAAVFANNDKAKKMLGWSPVLSLNEMMRSAWEWEKRMNQAT